MDTELTPRAIHTQSWKFRSFEDPEESFINKTNISHIWKSTSNNN